MATAPEVRATGRLAGDALAAGVRAVEHVHLSISRRVFDAIGPSAESTRRAHDLIAGGVYRGVSTVNGVAPRVAAAALARRHRQPSAEEAAPAAVAPSRRSGSSRAALAQSALNGLRGDVAERYPELVLPMSLRAHPTSGDAADAQARPGGDVTLDPSGLRAAYPDATRRLVLFVHGLCETDQSWWTDASPEPGAAPDSPTVPRRTSYGSMLHDELGFTPLYLRYNSGLHLVDNGRALSALLEQVVSAWPVPVTEIVPVGHSMGGLVIRSACHEAEIAGHDWAGAVRYVVCLGTPHFGAPLERGVDAAVRVLGKVPETRPLASFLANRSVGVKDLGRGLVAEQHTRVHDPFEFVPGCCSEVPFLPHATYCFVGATVTRDLRHPFGFLIGDLLVRYPSASGQSNHRRIPFELEHGAHIGGITHFALLHHPAVAEQLRLWLAPVPPESIRSVPTPADASPSAPAPLREDWSSSR